MGPVEAGDATLRITPPAPLTADHDLQDFSCGKQPLDDWLRLRAARSEGRSARTYVSCVGKSVIGYYCFASGAVRLADMPKPLARNAPQLVPITLLGRLAVDLRYQGRSVGKGLLRDALSRALQAARIVGSRAVLVHAIDEEAAGFYGAYGFMRFPEGAHTFFMPMETIAAAVREA